MAQVSQAVEEHVHGHGHGHDDHHDHHHNETFVSNNMADIGLYFR